MQTWREAVAALPHDIEVKPKGNSMTQEYCTDKVLPYYVNAIHIHRILEDRPRPWQLQEDGDPSHGKKVRGLAQILREENWIDSFEHPPQSPDLNPIKACWNILK